MKVVSFGKNDLLGKGKEKYRWSTTSRFLPRRIPQRNILKEAPGLRGRAKNVRTPVEAFDLFFSNEIIDHIVKHTNEELARRRQRKDDSKDMVNSHDEDSEDTHLFYIGDTDPIELKSFIGLNYIAGSFCINHLPTHEIFHSFYGNPYFRATMSQNRFKELTFAIRFDEKETREERKMTDKLAALRTVWDHVFGVSKNYYMPGGTLTLDEQTLGFRGRCSFKIYNPDKPDRYGIKIVILADSVTYYAFTAEIYIGKRTENPDIKYGHHYLRKLCEPIYGCNLTVTCDNFFTSVPAIEELLDKGVTVVGTVRKSQREIPAEVVETKNREPNTVAYLYSDKITLLSYVPPARPKKPKKNVILMSSTHDVPDKTKTVVLPTIVDYYNSTKSGVDKLDQMCKSYSAQRKTRRWPLALFYGLLNIIGINSMVIFNEATKIKQTRRKYLQTLGFSLIKPHMERRRQWPTLRRNVRDLITNVLEYEEKFSTPSQKRRVSSAHTLSTPRKKRDCSTGRKKNKPTPQRRNAPNKTPQKLECSSSSTNCNESSPTQRTSRRKEINAFSPDSPRKKQRRCYCCTRSEKKYSVTCAKCRNFVCSNHRVTLCSKC